LANGSTSYYRSHADGGVVCAGNYSYVWKHADRLYNSLSDGSNGNAPAIGDTGSLMVRFTETDAWSPVFRLVKFRDANRAACLVDASTGLLPTQFGPSAAGYSEFLELITNNEMDLALYDFKAFQPATSAATGQVFYGFSFVLGTIRGVNNGGSGGIVPNEGCVPPQARVNDPSNPDEPTNEREQLGFDFDYCSVNKFNFAARASGAITGGPNENFNH
jgi:hypothetical protein